MTESLVHKRESATVVIGALLILLGGSLLLDRLHLLHFRWTTMAWIVLATLGGYLAVDGFNRKRRWRVFWGTGLTFFSLFVVLTKLGVIERESFYTFPAILIALGFSFLALYGYQPKEYVLLLHTVFFIGVGVFSIFLWWDFFDWYDVRQGIRTYWPVAFIAWGIVLVIGRKKTA